MRRFLIGLIKLPFTIIFFLLAITVGQLARTWQEVVFWVSIIAYGYLVYYHTDYFLIRGALFLLALEVFGLARVPAFLVKMMASGREERIRKEESDKINASIRRGGQR